MKSARSAQETGNHHSFRLVEQRAIELAQELLRSERTVQVFLFGSRASGRAFPRSDFDVGIDLGRPLLPDALLRIRETFDALPIFQKVDVVDFANVDESFKTVARKAIRMLYERKAA